MAVVGMILHHEREQAADLARDAAAWLTERGHEVRLPIRDAGIAGLSELGATDEEFSRGLDLAVSLGGDGTMLRTVDLVAAEGVPVVGVNVGQLGYLSEVEPPGLRMALKRFLAGSFELEERMLLQVAVDAAGELEGEPPGAIGAYDDGSDSHLPRLAGGSFLALNEAVLEKTPMGHTVRLGVSIDGEAFTPYAADGLIVATPTGSTAYAFSARGPIVEPTHRCLLMTPVSPHMLFDRSLIFAPEARVRIAVAGDRPATLSVDGHNLGTLQRGDAITCTAASGSARFVTFGPRNFLRILKTKFGLSDR
ncbi:MAG: NAD(+)/NADH kinase [Acidimicrobiales bacterium]|nr:NAD(+)/NADH kinase [Acidimicrobiales bacterium]